MLLKFFKGIFALINGHFTVFKHLFMKAVTLEYPEKRYSLTKNFRGKPEVAGCKGCGVCTKVCPTGAIKYKKDDSGQVYFYQFDLKKCIFCGNCMYYCPYGAIKMTTEYELASENSDNLKLQYNNQERT